MTETTPPPAFYHRTDAGFDAYRSEPMADYSPAGVTHIEEVYRSFAQSCLDNMGPDLLREAVDLVGGRMITEASGRITPDKAQALAQAGVDLISAGWLTHSAAVLDIGLDHRS